MYTRVNSALRLSIIVISIATCHSTAEYEMFMGFDATIAADTVTPSTTHDLLNDNITSMINTSASTDAPTHVTVGLSSNNSASNVTNNYYSKVPTNGESVNITHTAVPKIEATKFLCPENEKPSSLGPYEVPTQRDLVLMIRIALRKRFNKYHAKTLLLLHDIKKATRASLELENLCHGDKQLYKRCVRDVSHRSEAITKGFVNSLEKKRIDVDGFNNDSICTINAMKSDPVRLIQRLAMEEASLEFELPGFLHLLNSCSHYCDSFYSTTRTPELTDIGLVVKYFLPDRSLTPLKSKYIKIRPNVSKKLERIKHFML